MQIASQTFAHPGEAVQIGETEARWRELLATVATAANRAERPAYALREALAAICRTTGWPVGHALEVTRGGNELGSAGVWYPTDLPPSAAFVDFQRASQNLRFEAGSGLPGMVLHNGRARFEQDFASRTDWPRQALAAAAGFGACFAFPVSVSEHVVAVLEFFAPAMEPAATGFEDTIARVGAELARVFTRSARLAALSEFVGHVRTALDTCIEAFIESDVDDRIVEWSRPATMMFGWTREEVIGRTVTDTIVPPAYRDAHREGVRHLVATGRPRAFGKRLEVTGLRRNGSEFPLEMALWSSRQGEHWRFFALLRDNTQRKAAEERLKRRANYDPLTGLPNRALVMEQMATLLEQPAARKERFAVLFVDLDHFKRINDSVGHEAGDQVLVAASGRFRNAVRPGDTVARLAGDEYLVVCPGIVEYRQAAAVAERILASLADPVHVGNDNVFLTASIGVALSNAGSNADAIVAAADMAMYNAKRSGRAGYELFDQKTRQIASSRLQLENELRGALEREELRLHYQPIVNSADGSIRAVEALMRWQHPTRGLLLPGAFIPVAEETGLIVPMGAWALREACRQAEQWSLSHITSGPIHLSVNLSARQLAQSDLVATVKRVMAGASIDPRYVEFGIEVTETMAMRDFEASTRVLHALRELGMRLSIDDFGTGYSSLAYLGQLPADTLKVDISFVRRVAIDPVRQAIVRSVVDLGHALGMTIVAEGVETPEQRTVLRELGVDLLQGFLFARALPPAELRAFAAVQAPRAASAVPDAVTMQATRMA